MNCKTGDLNENISLLMIHEISMLLKDIVQVGLIDSKSA